MNDTVINHMAGPNKDTLAPQTSCTRECKTIKTATPSTMTFYSMKSAQNAKETDAFESAEVRRKRDLKLLVSNVIFK